MTGTLEALLTDCRDTVRSLRRSERFAAMAVITFALGIGANVGLMAMVDRLMFRPLPYGEQGRLVHVHAYTSTSPTFSAAQIPFEITDVLSQEAQSFEGFGWVDAYPEVTVAAPGENPLILRSITANALELLKVSPLLGRRFVQSDSNAGSTRMVVLTEEAWRTRFGGSSQVLDAAWSTGPLSYRVIGVLPAGFLLPSSHFVEQFHGLTVSTGSRFGAGALIVAPFGRLRPGVTVQTGQAEVDVILKRHQWASSALRRGVADGTLHVTVQPLQAGLSVLVKPYLWLIVTAVWIVLAVTCVNLATLLLARAQSRRYELTIRASLGASPTRLVRLPVLEGVAICGIGSVVAMVICQWTYRSLLVWVPGNFHAFAVTPLDGRIVAMTLGAATASALLVSALPALGACRVSLVRALQHRGRGVGGPWRHWGALLLSLQAAFAAMLVIGAGATVPRFMTLLLRSPGFDVRDLYTVSVGHNWPSDAAGAQERRRSRIETILGVVNSSPYVEVVAAALSLPLHPSAADSPFWNQRALAGDEWAVSATVFETLKTPILAGRPFSEAEVSQAALVAILNDSGARALWPGEHASQAIGRSVTTSGGSRRVIGVVSDVRRSSDAPPVPALFLPITSDEVRPSQSALPVLVRMEPGRIPDQAMLTRRLNEVFPKNRVAVRSVQKETLSWMERPRFLAGLLGSLASIAIILAAVGVYALASVEVSSRRYETAVRMALGATASKVRRGIAAAAVIPTLIGTAAGLMLTWWGAPLLGAAVADIGLRESWLYGAAACATSLTAILAVWVPARRAVSDDLTSVLRSS